jgi:hypothetical protein
VVDAELKLISAGTHIPLRILTGSERGELASTSDDDNWVAYINERRMKFAEPVMVREIVDRLSTVGVITTPPQDYAVEWPKLTHQSKREQAEIATAKTNALVTYVSGGANILLPEDWFLRDVLGYDEDQVDEIMAAAEKRAEEIAADEAAVVEQQAMAAAKAAAATGAAAPAPAVGGKTGKGQAPLQSGASRQQAMGKKVAPAITEAATGPREAPLSLK